MTTNILSLPQFSSGSFAIANNAAWNDSIFFAAPGYGPPLTINGCSTSAGSNTVTVPAVTTTAGIVPHMQVSGPPLPSASYVGSVLTATTFTIVDVNGNTLTAPSTSVEVQITLQPPPLDLTGIIFGANLRRAISTRQVFLTASTGLGSMVNGGMLGTLAFNVSRSAMQAVPTGVYVMDILAKDGPTVVNLFPQSPAIVTVSAGVTDLTTIS